MPTLEELNASKQVSSWAWMGGFLSGLAHEKYYFSLPELRRDDDRWEGQFTCGNGVLHPFLVFMGDPERNVILEASTPEKIYQLKRREVALLSVPPWDKYIVVPFVPRKEWQGERDISAQI